MFLELFFITINSVAHVDSVGLTHAGTNACTADRCSHASRRHACPPGVAYGFSLGCLDGAQPNWSSYGHAVRRADTTAVRVPVVEPYWTIQFSSVRDPHGPPFGGTDD